MHIKQQECYKCPLNGIQAPLLDKYKKADIMIIGLSAKKHTFDNERPLDTRTRSGKVIDELDQAVGRQGLSMYRSNLVKCAPIDRHNKLRYPNQQEIDRCFENIKLEIIEVSPRIIVVLGEMVRATFETKWNIQIKKPTETEIPVLKLENRWIISMYHPSYLMRSQKRKVLHISLFDKIISEIIGDN